MTQALPSDLVPLFPQGLASTYNWEHTDSGKSWLICVSFSSGVRRDSPAPHHSSTNYSLHIFKLMEHGLFLAKSLEITRNGYSHYKFTDADYENEPKYTSASAVKHEVILQGGGWRSCLAARILLLFGICTEHFLVKFYIACVIICLWWKFIDISEEHITILRVDE